MAFLCLTSPKIQHLRELPQEAECATYRLAGVATRFLRALLATTKRERKSEREKPLYNNIITKLFSECHTVGTDNNNIIKLVASWPTRRADNNKTKRGISLASHASSEIW